MPLWYQTVRSSMLLVQSVAGMLTFWYAIKKRRGFGMRLALSMILGIILTYAAQTALYTLDTTCLGMLRRQLSSVVNIACLLGVAFACFDESLWTIIMVGCTGSITQDIGGTIKEMAKLNPYFNALCLDPLGVILADLVCYGGVLLVLYFLFRPYTRHFEDDEHERRTKVIVSLFIIVMRLTLVRIMRDAVDPGATAMLVTNTYHLLVGIMVLMLQFGVLERFRLTRQVDMMDELLHQQYSQYAESQATVELIHEKYHDLKQMLVTLDGIVPDHQLHRIKDAIKRYESRVHSGNKVLDVLLTQKVDLCIQRSITTTVDLGNINLAFMEELDVYTLFHNALNNAINAVSALPEGIFRCIVLQVKESGNIITIHMENPCQDGIVFEDGLPQTAGDARYHGFGMRSMVRIAEKYGGTLAACAQNGQFYLDILLIRPENR